ncbi:hypothetical protein CEUSTIGMA_g7938.t1 [Chlamydomonas eustigma]|uniref:Uncharacterized protein n=1 Tax=Chlamydomonas eustigma TaxID=1157962 RepID=A0A250XCL3_9CHLO|nr:hypothetical protein CEUSTIGMA_g7938.t1 [Chlamydomonas eustigma]|eukprot:GAX80500.1 hypothetical protein CEUSTIGMA_g7938.t1 [Chlamydomonas eustigma]
MSVFDDENSKPSKSKPFVELPPQLRQGLLALPDTISEELSMHMNKDEIEAQREGFKKAVETAIQAATERSTYFPVPLDHYLKRPNIHAEAHDCQEEDEMPATRSKSDRGLYDMTDLIWSPLSRTSKWLRRLEHPHRHQEEIGGCSADQSRNKSSRGGTSMSSKVRSWCRRLWRKVSGRRKLDQVTQDATHRSSGGGVESSSASQQDLAVSSAPAGGFALDDQFKRCSLFKAHNIISEELSDAESNHEDHNSSHDGRGPHTESRGH